MTRNQAHTLVAMFVVLGILDLMWLHIALPFWLFALPGSLGAMFKLNRNRDATEIRSFTANLAALVLGVNGLLIALLLIRGLIVRG